MTKLELLAPAKDPDHGKAAISHGADAVYTGAPMFSARKAAGTTVSQIEELARFAHQYKARVYVAMNTILFDHELDKAEKMIHEVYEAGADALIIQDMGILEMNLPPVPLFASTQTHNISPEKVLFLEKAGFLRVILARELTLQEIGKIREKTTVELESFVHGALCVSYSGQCYMSHSVCGRSGNRGDCAQPCRSSYNLTDKNGKVLVKDKHLISLRDLNLSQQIPELINAGITSFKIEGRLKDMSYVKNVVSNYRLILDNYLENHNGFTKASSGKTTFSFTPNPEKTFNRGYTAYNIHGRTEKISTFHTQKSIGTKVGEVQEIKGNKLKYKGEKLTPGDGICYFTKENELKGFNVNRFEDGVIIASNTDDVYQGVVLYRNYDIQFDHTLKQSAGNRKIPVDMHITGNENMIQLQISDEDGNTVLVKKEITSETVRDREYAENFLKLQLGKLGNTLFGLNTIKVEMTEMPFIRISLVNELRREATDLLTELRLKKYTRETSVIEKSSIPFPWQKLDYRFNISNHLAEKFYKRHGAEILEKAYELNSDIGDGVVMETKHCIRYQLDACLLTNRNNPLPEPLYLKDQHTSYRLRFKCRECVMQIVKEP